MNVSMLDRVARWSQRLGFACCMLLLPPQLHAQTMNNVHVNSSGTLQTVGINSDIAVISDDDRWIAFSSPATNLDPLDWTPDADIFVHDNLTGATVVIEPSMTEARRPAISANGRFLVFQAPGPANAAEVYWHDRDPDADGIFDEAGATATVLVSVSSPGGPGNGVSRSYEWAISDDGTRVAFESEATNLVGATDTNDRTDCFVRDMSTGTTVRVSESSAGTLGDLGSHYPAISGNGLRVAFMSSSTNLVSDDTNSAEDVFVRTLATGITERASVGTGGGQANGYSAWPALSDDGNRLVFASTAANLVTDDTNGGADVFLRDLASGVTTRVSLDSSGNQATTGTDGAYCAISGDGNVVAFTSTSSNLAAGANAYRQVYARNLTTGVTARASRAVDGTTGDLASFWPAVSEDGSHVTFLSDATNLLGPGGDTNDRMDAYVRGQTFVGPGGTDGGPPPPAMGPDDNPVSFSVNGPVDQYTEGIRDARGAPPSLQMPPEPGNPLGFCVRTPPAPLAMVPQAAGLASPRPGDVFDYNAVAFPSEAEMFQSAPPPPPPGGPPDGTDNQVLAAMALGLVAGPGVPLGLSVSAPGTMPPAPPRDNIDAFSFGEDYFPAMMVRGLDGMLPLPDPPVDEMGEILTAATPWSARMSVYKEPIIVGQAPGISFRFSADPWALGAAGSAVLTESGGADGGIACGPWASPGDAAGDVFGTPLLTKAGGLAIGGGTNMLVHDNPTLALAPVPALPTPIEDDLDALECVGENNVPWFSSISMMPGNLWQRIVGDPMLPPPGVSSHDVLNTAPEFFSVTRSSTGAPGSAVESQFKLDGGAAADVFVTAKDPASPLGVGTNLLFMDEAELGLLAIDASPGGTGAADLTDDLDALILWVRPEERAAISHLIDEIMATKPWVVDPATGALTGPGMTISLVKLLAPLPPGSIRVGFSVTTDAVGLEYTAVDWEAGPVFPPGGIAAAAGDIYYVEASGSPANANYLWYEEIDLGLDAGAWVNGIPGASLAALTDNLDALDSIGDAPEPTDVGMAPAPRQRLRLEPNFPNPFNPTTTIAFTLPEGGSVQLAIFDVRGRQVATLLDGTRPAGRNQVTWDGRAADGGRLPGGTYFVRLQMGDESCSRRIVLVK